MPRNVEIKAQIEGDVTQLKDLIQSFADGPARDFTQNDTFFNCPTGGRLKLRTEQDSPAKLIYYERDESMSLSTPKVSDYWTAPVSHPEELKVVLTLAMGGIRGEVNKHRTLFLVGGGQTRVHVDQVHGLEPKSFVELEVALRNDQTPEQGQQIAHDLCAKMGIEEKDHIKCAYIDLLLAKNDLNRVS